MRHNNNIYHMNNNMYNTFPPYMLKILVNLQLVKMTKRNNRSIEDKQMKTSYKREIKYKISDLFSRITH